MNILTFITFLAIALNFGISLSLCKIENIVVRPALQPDLKSIIEVDTHVSYEHFKPIFANHYANLWIGQYPDEFLEKDIKNDIENFEKCITDPSNDQKLLIAYDNSKQACVGFIIFHKDNNKLVIDLLLIEKEYRNLGIGKKLMQRALTIFDNINICNLHVLKFGNEAAQKFYESLGFVNIGEPPADSKGDGFKHKDLHFLYQLEVKEH